MIGFHGGTGNGMNGIDQNYIQVLNDAGKKAYLKSVNNVGVVKDALENNRDNVCIIRFAGGGIPDLPTYGETVSESIQNARDWFYQYIYPKLMFDDMQSIKNDVWVEVMNEPDKNIWDHICAMTLELIKILNGLGFKACGPGVNNGEPEPEHWNNPHAMALTLYLERNFDIAALSLHEGKGATGVDINEEIVNLTDWLIGRINRLYEYPWVTKVRFFVSEFGWAYNDIASKDIVLRDINDALNYYMQVPGFSGAFMWNLNQGSEWSGLPEKLNSYIPDITELMLTLPDETGDDSMSRGSPRVQYNRTYILIPPSAGKAWASAAIDATWDNNRYTVGGSADDAGIGDLDTRNIIAVNPHLWGPGEDGNGLSGFYNLYYPLVNYQELFADTPQELFALLSGEDPGPPGTPIYIGPAWNKTFNGMHDRSDRHPRQVEFDFFNNSIFNSVKFQTGTTQDEIANYNTSEFNLCRIYESLEGRSLSIDQAYNSIVPDMQKAYDAGIRYYELYNEPNLTLEGLAHGGIIGTWSNGYEFADFFIELKRRLKQTFPLAKIGFPGLSPGGDATIGFGVHYRVDSEQFIVEADAAVVDADFLCVHAYYVNDVNAAVNEVLLKRNQYPSKLIFVSEYSNPTGDNSQTALHGQEAKSFVNKVSNIPGIGGVYYFIVSGQGWQRASIIDENGALTKFYDGFQ